MTREQTKPRLRTKTPLLPGMLKCTKYSRLRNDSLTSQEDRPHRTLPLKRDLCSESDVAQSDPGTPTSPGQSTLRDFIPRVANIRLQSPVSLQGLRRRTDAGSDRTAGLRPDGRSPGTGSCSGTNQRLRGQHLLSVPLSTGRTLPPSALSRTKRPVSLWRTRRWPAGDGLRCPEPSSASEDCRLVRTADRAVHHHVKYMGSVEVTQSMRALDFHTRIQVTQEAISRLCERASSRTAVRTKGPSCKRRSAVLGQVNLQFSGNRIILTVSTDSVTLVAASSSQTIAHHPMQAISFASGGDPAMADYIAYVAKDDINQRACHILECPQGRAGEVINSIRQAFETCFRQLLSHPPSLLSTNPRSSVRLCHKWRPAETTTNQRAKRDSGTSEHGDYYNVIQRGATPAGETGLMRTSKEEDERHADEQAVYLSQPVSPHENGATSEESSALPADSVESAVGAQHCPLPSETQIQDEGWFHGRLGREQAESLLTCSGDFLVRESSSASGQYVLSSMEGDTVRHLLLVDPHGQVRTRDQVFQSIGHLVRFHMENQMPIVSGSSELCLKQPVLQRY